MPAKSTASKSPSTSKAVVKSDPAVANFQRLAKAFMSAPPPGHDESVVPSTLCTFERQFSSGYRQTISLLQAGDQKFVQTVAGNEKYLPVALRSVKMKRGRELVEDDDDEEITLSSDDESPRTKKGKGREKKGETPKKSRSSRHQNSLFTPDGQHSDASPRSGPRAPRKTRSHRRSAPSLDAENNYEAGDETETESTVASVLRAVRRSTRQADSQRKSKSAHREVKVEMTEDDLSSLCGGFEGIEVQSSIDAESEYGTPAPMPSTSLRSGSVRA